MKTDWDEIEQVAGFAGLRAHAEAQVLPMLASADLQPADMASLRKQISRAMSAGFFSFVVSFLVLQFLLPNAWWGEVLRFMMFPLLFIGCVLGALWFSRGKLLRLLLDAKTRYLARGKALAKLVAPLGISYVPTPGGPPAALKWIAAQAWAPEELRRLTWAMQEAGGMDAAVAAANEAGLLQAQNTYMLGTAEQKQRYQETAAGHLEIEDGFHGVRGGIAFDMFEWVEKVSEASDIHHLVIVLEAPFQLHGVTQLRARKTGWPAGLTGGRLLDVGLGPQAFEARYRLRSSDQVEARALFNPAVIERVIDLAHDGPFRAVARGERLVVDFPGTDRFRLVDLVTGDWGEPMLRQTAADLAEALALVDTLAHAFMLARKPDTSAT